MNPYADIQIDNPGFMVEVRHGSGDGRSYGYATVLEVQEGDWFNSDQTRTYIGPFTTKQEADACVNEQNNYYDGSDYQ